MPKSAWASARAACTAALLVQDAQAELVVVPGADHAGPQFDGHPLPEAALSFPAAALE